MGICNIGHSRDDVMAKLEIQKEFFAGKPCSGARAIYAKRTKAGNPQ